MCGLPAYTAIVKKELHQHNSESHFILNACELHNPVYIYAAVLTNWISLRWVQLLLPQRDLRELLGPPCHCGEKKHWFFFLRVSLGFGMNCNSDDMVGIFSPAPTVWTWCEEPSCFTSIEPIWLLLGRGLPKVHHLPTADQEKNKRGQPLAPRSSHLCSCPMSLCNALMTALVSVSHAWNIPSTLLLCLPSYPLPQLLLSISRRGSCVSVVS